MYTVEWMPVIPPIVVAIFHCSNALPSTVAGVKPAITVSDTSAGISAKKKNVVKSPGGLEVFPPLILNADVVVLLVTAVVLLATLVPFSQMDIPDGPAR